MRVLHVLNTGKYSGAENVVITLIHALEGTVDCAYASPDGPIKEILEEENIKYFSVHAPAINAKELKKIIKSFNPDIIHTHDFNAGIMACLTGSRVPIINHLHNNTPWLRKVCIKSFVYALSCVRYQKILTVSESVMQEYVFGNKMIKKTQVVGNPVSVSDIRNKADEPGILRDATDVIFLGRLSKQKNPSLFLEIVEEMVKVLPNIKVAIVGNGELYEQIQGAIEEKKLGKNITLYGFQKNPYGLLKASKVMCMPSVWEGFGLAAVEALTFGKPVIATPVGGLKDIVTDRCGKLCRGKSEFSSEIVELLSNEKYYNLKSCGALLRCADYDNVDKYSEIIKNVYKMCSIER